MLSCQGLTELVTDYLEGQLSLWRRLQMELHLGMCKHCRSYLRQMKTTVRVTGSLPKEPIPDDMKALLLARLKDMPPREP